MRSSAVAHGPGRRATALLLALAALAASGAATADSSHPDCEPGQPSRLAGVALLRLCEGGHWEGASPLGANEVGVRYGSGPAMSVSDPAHAAALTDLSDVYVSLALLHVGQASAFASVSSGTVAVWAKDDSERSVAGTPVVGLLVQADHALGRPNPGADGNVLWWAATLPAHAARAAGRSVPVLSDQPHAGEGDCDAGPDASGACRRDNVAFTLVLDVLP